MPALIPILSRKEDNPEFIEKASHSSEEVFLLAVIDKTAMLGGFGFAASDISQSNKLMEKMVKFLVEKGKKCEAIIEWGDTFQTIDKMAKLKKAEQIFLLRQNNHFFQQLAKKLSESKNYGVQVIEITEPKPEEKK